MTKTSQRTTMTVSYVCQRLHELALQMEPGQKLPTVNELCTQFGTSRATLDEALNKLEQQNVIYRKHSKGIFVSEKIHRKTICVLLDSSLLAKQSHSPFWGELWHLFAQEAQQRALTRNEYHSFHLLMRTPDHQLILPEEIVSMMRSNRVHGFLAIGICDYEWSEPRDVPCVTFAGYDRWMVSLDNKQLQLMAVKRLVEQGCRNIGLWSPTIVTVDGLEPPTSDEFRYFLTLLDLPYHPELFRTISPEVSAGGKGLSYQEQGYQIVLDVFGNPDTPRPDGIIVSDEMLMVGVMAAFNRLNLHIGEDVKIVTHANVGSMLVFNHIPGLTVIEFDPEELVKAMYALLDKLLAGEKPTEAEIKIVPRLRIPTNMLEQP